MKVTTYLKAILGLCQCKGCRNFSAYDITINKSIVRRICIQCTKDLIKIADSDLTKTSELVEVNYE